MHTVDFHSVFIVFFFWKILETRNTMNTLGIRCVCRSVCITLRFIENAFCENCTKKMRVRNLTRKQNK